MFLLSADGFLTIIVTCKPFLQKPHFHLLSPHFNVCFDSFAASALGGRADANYDRWRVNSCVVIGRAQLRWCSGSRNSSRYVFAILIHRNMLVRRDDGVRYYIAVRGDGVYCRGEGDQAPIYSSSGELAFCEGSIHNLHGVC